MDYKILPGHLYSQKKRINLYYLHNLFKNIAAYISAQMKELYNIDTDPGEEVNVANNNPEVASRLLIDLETWFEEMENERQNIPKE